MGRCWQLGALALVMLLAACSSIPIGTGNGARNLDLLNDDVASLLLAFDLPPSLEPAPEGSSLSLAINAGGQQKLVSATLVAAEADELAGTLPPPLGDRNYYLFGFADADKAAIREAQAWARARAPATYGVSLFPRLCRTEPLDPRQTAISALVALPGAMRLSPLISNVPLSTVLAQIEASDAPPCAGHSG